jgi:hypothetical protein
VCDACQKAKSHQLPFPKSLSVSHFPLALVFSDVLGPARLEILNTMFPSSMTTVNSFIDRILIKRLMMTYTSMNYNIVALIRQDLTCKKMTSDDVLERIMNYEMNIQEANNIKNLYKDVSISKK